MDYQESIELLKGEIKCSCYRNRGYCGICTIYSELDRDKIIDACKCAISAMQELQEQREIINKNKDYSEVQKWMQNIIDDAMVCLDEMKRDAKKNLNTHYIPLLYEGRKRKAKTVIYALIELNAYKQLGTLEEVREAVEKHKWIPCSERLPEMHREDMEAEGEYYMISNPVLATDGNKIYVAEYEEYDGYIYGWHSLDGEDYENIIAWIPLPEPYNPERSGK